MFGEQEARESPELYVDRIKEFINGELSIGNIVPEQISYQEILRQIQAHLKNIEGINQISNLIQGDDNLRDFISGVTGTSKKVGGKSKTRVALTGIDSLA